MVAQQIPLLLEDKKSVETALDWDYVGTRHQYATHALHPYLASMIPPIPKRLLRKYQADGNTRVLDPFVGGGSVTTEAFLNNVPSAGVDINDLAVIISKAKATPISRAVLATICREFDDAFHASGGNVPNFPKQSNITYWFKDYTFEPLAKVREAIESVAEQVDLEERDSARNLLQCVFSYTIRSVSLTYRSEIRLRRLKGRDLKHFQPDVYAEFKKRLTDAVSRVKELPIENSVPEICTGDTRQLNFEDKSFDLIITSPPYGDVRNTIPYHQFSKNMLLWLGYTYDDVELIRDNSLGGIPEDKSRYTLPESETLVRAVEHMERPSAIRDATFFYSDYSSSLREITRVGKQRIIIVIGHRVLNNVLIDNAQITTELLSNLGWRLEDVFERRIPGKRLHRAMAFGNQSRGATIDKESILVYSPQ